MIENQLFLAPELMGPPEQSPTASVHRRIVPHHQSPQPAVAATVPKTHRLAMDQKTPKTGDYSVTRYTGAHKLEWDRFIGTAKNATFMFARDYMDYHSDRFTDHSLLIFQDETLVAVLPANLKSDGSLISHEGLTFGGLVVSRGASLCDVLEFFHALLGDLNRRQIAVLRYKQIPAFYNTLPDDDVAYALFLLEARLYRRDCAAVVVQADRLPLRKGHQGLIKRAIKLGVEIVEETTFQPFMEKVLAPRLAERYGTKPVHTLAELTLLAKRFPEQIRQFSAYCGEEILAGTTIYETQTVAHAQYAAATDKGRQMGAQAYLFSTLVDQYQSKRCFDFGISNENEGRALNHGLLDWKEGFGARCYAHHFYEIATANYVKLESLLRPRLATALAEPPANASGSSSDGQPRARSGFAQTEAEAEEGEMLCRKFLATEAVAVL